MKKNIKLIIGICIFIILVIGVILIYYFNEQHKEETMKKAKSVGIVKVTNSNFEEEVLNADKPVILDFSSNSCPPCVAMLTTLIDIAKNNDNIKVATINVDSKDSSDIIDEYPIEGTPTIMIFDQGEVKSTLVGAVSEDKILNELK